jgi:hypothetical protein
MGTVSNIVGRLRELIAIPGNPIGSPINMAANLIEQLERELAETARRPRPSLDKISAAFESGDEMLTPQERVPDYRVGRSVVRLLLFIGARAFAVGMAIPNEALANQHVPQTRESSIYYCATGDEMPLYEPCKEMKVERNIRCPTDRTTFIS